MRNPIPVETEGRTIFVHPITAGQYRRLFQFLTGKDGDPITADFMLLAMCCRDADGKPLYASGEEAEGMSLEECEALLPVCVSFNRLRAEDMESKKKPSDSAL